MRVYDFLYTALNHQAATWRLARGAGSGAGMGDPNEVLQHRAGTQARGRQEERARWAGTASKLGYVSSEATRRLPRHRRLSHAR